MKKKGHDPGAQALEDLEAMLATRRLELDLRDAVPRIEEPEPAHGVLVVAHQGGGSWSINRARVAQIERALCNGVAIDEVMLKEIRAILAHVAIEGEKRRPSARPRDRELTQRAAMVLQLRDEGVSLKEAISAVHPDATSRERENLAKAQRALSKSGLKVYTSKRRVDASRARLRK